MHGELAVGHFLDGDALAVAAVIGTEVQPVGGVALVLHHKLLVRLVDIELQAVLGAHFEAGQLGVAIPAAHFHGEPVLSGDHCGHLGVHHTCSLKGV